MESNAHDADVPDLAVERGHHVAGEFDFTPEHLTLSLYLGPPLTIEQEADRPWQGVSVRGDIKVMVPGQRRCFCHRRAAEFATIEIRGANRSIAPRLMLREPPITQLAFSLVRANLDRPARMYREAVGARLVALLRAVDGWAEAPPRRGLPQPALRRVLDYLDANVADDVSVTQLAAVAGLRPSHFNALFRNSTGQPPHRYHLGLRVERACELLERGYDPTRAAHEVGFYDASHLIRHMRRFLGVTPGQISRGSRPTPRRSS